MNATGYIRRSKKSESNTVSLEEQERQVREYCARLGYELAALVRHDGISGAKRSRFDEINKAVNESASGILVVYNLDRLARDAAGLLDHLRSLTDRGVDLHEVASGKLDLSRSTSKLTVAVRGAMDEFFRDVISEKTADALRYKRQNGQRYTNIPPIGYQYQAGEILENPQEQLALRIIAECRAKGLGARRTRHELIRAGYTGRMGITTLHRLLHRQDPVSIKAKLPAAYFALPELS